jgi:hypothetical protein
MGSSIIIIIASRFLLVSELVIKALVRGVIDQEVCMSRLISSCGVAAASLLIFTLWCCPELALQGPHTCLP